MSTPDVIAPETHELYEEWISREAALSDDLAYIISLISNTSSYRTYLNTCWRSPDTFVSIARAHEKSFRPLPYNMLH